MSSAGYAKPMKHTDWFYERVGTDSVNAAAGKSGVIQRTLARQLEVGTLPAESVIKISRAYGYSPIQGLVDTGYLNATESRGGVTVINWADVSDADLLGELLRRTDSDGTLPSSLWDAPLDDEAVATVHELAFPNGPVSDASAIKAAKRKDGRRASVEGAEGSTP